MRFDVYPIQCVPIYKEALWGGDRIAKIYPNHHSFTDYCAESWEITDRSDGVSLIANGVWKGKNLHEYIQSDPTKILGTACRTKRFPLLIKLIDARKQLSVQVHPSFEVAEKLNTEPKEEMWYFLNETTNIIHGLQGQISKETFQESLKNNRLTTLLRTFKVKPNQAVFTPGGCVHSIGAGNLLLEIQNSSNTTYRIHDWNRVDVNGKSRALQIERALDCIQWESSSFPFLEPKCIFNSSECKIDELITCRFFCVEKLYLKGTFQTDLSGRTFQTLFVLEGNLRIKWEETSKEIEAGTSLLIPAALGKYTLQGEAKLIRAMLPKNRQENGG